MKQDTLNFLSTVLWTGNRDSGSAHDFHPEFVAAAESFIDGFRAYLAADLGFDTDSRKAEQVYKECLAFGDRLSAAGLTGKQIRQFAEYARRL